MMLGLGCEAGEDEVKSTLCPWGWQNRVFQLLHLLFSTWLPFALLCVENKVVRNFTVCELMWMSLFRVKKHYPLCP